MKLKYDFNQQEKGCMLRCLSKYTEESELHEAVMESLKLDGSTILWPDEAHYLAAFIRTDYYGLSERIKNHPGLLPEDQRMR